MIIYFLLEKFLLKSLILHMNINSLIQNNPNLFRIISIVLGLIIAYVIYILR